MKKVGDLLISDKTEEEMIRCVDEYGIYAYTYYGENAVGILVCKDELLDRALKAQDYLREHCPEIQWFAGGYNWTLAGRDIYVNCCWMLDD